MWRVLSTFTCLLIGGVGLSAPPSVQMLPLMYFSQSCCDASLGRLSQGVHGSVPHSVPMRTNLGLSSVVAIQAQPDSHGYACHRPQRHFPMSSSLGLSGDLPHLPRRVAPGFVPPYRPTKTSRELSMARASLPMPAARGSAHHCRRTRINQGWSTVLGEPMKPSAARAAGHSCVCPRLKTHRLSPIPGAS